MRQFCKNFFKGMRTALLMSSKLRLISKLNLKRLSEEHAQGTLLFIEMFCSDYSESRRTSGWTNYPFPKFYWAFLINNSNVILNSIELDLALIEVATPIQIFFVRPQRDSNELYYWELILKRENSIWSILKYWI